MENNDHVQSQSLIRAQDAARFPAHYYPPPEGAGYLREPEEEEKINLLDYWRVLVKRRWTILSFVFAVLAITAIATWKATPVYRSTIKLQIDPEQQSLLPFKEAQDFGSSYAQSQEYLQTQFKVLESKTLAARVIKALDLDTNPQFVEESMPSAKSKTIEFVENLFGLSDKKDDKNTDSAMTEGRKLAKLVKSFGKNLSASPIRNSRLVDVSFEARDPKLAANVVNQMAKEYIDMNLDTKYNSTTAATDYLSTKIVDLKAKVEKSEEELVRFSQSHDIYEISEKENVILQKLSDLNTALTDSQAERIKKESVWNIIQQAGPGNFPDVLRNELIKSLETNLATLKVQQAKLAASFRPGWPELDQITGQVVEAEAQLATERQKAIKNVETEFRTAVQREKLLKQSACRTESGSQQLQSELDSIQYSQAPGGYGQATL